MTSAKNGAVGESPDSTVWGSTRESGPLVRRHRTIALTDNYRSIELTARGWAAVSWGAQTVESSEAGRCSTTRRPLTPADRLDRSEGSVEPTCSVPTCDKPPHTRSWCIHHYGRWYRTGDPLGHGSRPPKHTPCAVEDCDRTDHKGLQMCGKHYARFLRSGTTAKRESASIKDRLLSQRRIEENGCWTWMGRILSGGYGQMGVHGTQHPVHRIAYEEWVAPIPDGLTLDHLCHTRDLTCPGGRCLHRRCFNPEHLEPVTLADNIGRYADRLAKRTHCKHGHEWTPENTHAFQRNGRWRRSCRACGRIKSAAHAERKRACGLIPPRQSPVFAPVLALPVHEDQETLETMRNEAVL